MFKFIEGERVKIRSDLIRGEQYGDKLRRRVPRSLMGAEGIISEVDYYDKSCKIVFSNGNHGIWMPFEVIKKNKQFNGLEVD